ncbi:arginase family protein [Roseovarius rhodophyticola]|uniref:Arginase family protein n=1 Tax=Roseovarius rhodophyticola TaxID=3080827 RepID=A0ABZ2TC42_9RHOB|nr:arginase family protein [Roseovarius sp. W115]MDV2930517.1 arginase family protein [Roseovarius sp. W115]
MAKIGIVEPQKTGPFVGPATFMNVPYSTDLTIAKAAILGVPYDGGLHPTRIGSRTGPASIREHSLLVRPYQPPFSTFNPLTLLNVIDCGDADTTPSVIEDSFHEIEEAASAIFGADAAMLAFGGDGNITLPLLRAAHKSYPDLAVLHIDAHTDTYAGDGNRDYLRFNVATTFTRAAEEGLIDVEASIHVGARGPVADGTVFDHTRSIGYELIDGAEMFRDGLDVTATRLKAQLQDRPVYLCFDMDFFDPSCAPGVCTTTWGGATAREGLDFLRALSGLNLVGADINTVSPPHDLGGMTAFLAGTVALEILTLFCFAQNLVSDQVS